GAGLLPKSGESAYWRTAPSPWGEEWTLELQPRHWRVRTRRPDDCKRGRASCLQRSRCWHPRAGLAWLQAGNVRAGPACAEGRVRCPFSNRATTWPTDLASRQRDPRSRGLRTRGQQGRGQCLSPLRRALPVCSGLADQGARVRLRVVAKVSIARLHADGDGRQLGLL